MKLIQGEQLDLISTPKFSVDPDSDLELQYESGEFRIVTEQGRTQLRPLADAVVRGDTYDLEPNYQRSLAWDEIKQSQLIESFLMNVPVPPIFLYERQYAFYEVMDGLQRLKSIVAFYNDELILQGLEVWSPLNGRCRSELPIKIQQGIDRRYLSSVILMTESARTESAAGNLKTEVFSRLNTGGMALTDQELRNASSNGPLADEIERIATSSEPFRVLWGVDLAEEARAEGQPLNSSQTELVARQGAQELVLRFFANRQRTTIPAKSTQKILLDRYWDLGNAQLNEDTVSRIGRIFERTCGMLLEIFGTEALYAIRPRQGQLQTVRTNSVLIYDTLTSAFADFVDKEDQILENRAAVREAVHQVYINYSSDFDGRKTSDKNYQRRVQLINEAIASVVDR